MDRTNKVDKPPRWTSDIGEFLAYNDDTAERANAKNYLINGDDDWEPMTAEEADACIAYADYLNENTLPIYGENK